MASYQISKTPGIWPDLVIRHPQGPVWLHLWPRDDFSSLLAAAQNIGPRGAGGFLFFWVSAIGDPSRSAKQ
jgi:hypothetical protein